MKVEVEDEETTATRKYDKCSKAFVVVRCVSRDCCVRGIISTAKKVISILKPPQILVGGLDHPNAT